MAVQRNSEVHRGGSECDQDTHDTQLHQPFDTQDTFDSIHRSYARRSGSGVRRKGGAVGRDSVSRAAFTGLEHCTENR